MGLTSKIQFHFTVSSYRLPGEMDSLARRRRSHVNPPLMASGVFYASVRAPMAVFIGSE